MVFVLIFDRAGPAASEELTKSMGRRSLPDSRKNGARALQIDTIAQLARLRLVEKLSLNRIAAHMDWPTANVRCNLNQSHFLQSPLSSAFKKSSMILWSEKEIAKACALAISLEFTNSPFFRSR